MNPHAKKKRSYILILQACAACPESNFSQIDCLYSSPALALTHRYLEIDFKFWYHFSLDEKWL